MSELPDPMVPAEVDLRDFKTMPLDVQQLRDSRFASEVRPEAFRAGVLLWCAAWHQKPAGSLPNNDAELAKLAGYGFVVKEWRKVKTEALTKFILCSDGRWYHEEVSERVLTAWGSRLEHFYDRAKERLRKLNKGRSLESPPRQAIAELTFDEWNQQRISAGIPMEKADAFRGIPTTPAGTSAGFPAESPTKGEGTERRGNGEGEGTERESSSGSEANASGGKPPAATRAAKDKTPADEESSRLWAGLKTLLVDQQTCTRFKEAGVLLGKHAAKYGKDVFLEAARATVAAHPADAHTYLVALCEVAAGKRASLSRGPKTDDERARLNAESNAELERSLGGTTGGEIIDAVG